MRGNDRNIIEYVNWQNRNAIRFCQVEYPQSDDVTCDLGLDARAAAIVMRVVRNTVNTGRTVVCTIHQVGH